MNMNTAGRTFCILSCFIVPQAGCRQVFSFPEPPLDAALSDSSPPGEAAPSPDIIIEEEVRIPTSPPVLNCDAPEPISAFSDYTKLHEAAISPDGLQLLVKTEDEYIWLMSQRDNYEMEWPEAGQTELPRRYQDLALFQEGTKEEGTERVHALVSENPVGGARQLFQCLDIDADSDCSVLQPLDIEYQQGRPLPPYPPNDLDGPAVVRVEDQLHLFFNVADYTEKDIGTLGKIFHATLTIDSTSSIATGTQAQELFTSPNTSDIAMDDPTVIKVGNSLVLVFTEKNRDRTYHTLTYAVQPVGAENFDAPRPIWEFAPDIDDRADPIMYALPSPVEGHSIELYFTKYPVEENSSLYRARCSLE